jgi:putative membrane protein
MNKAVLALALAGFTGMAAGPVIAAPAKADKTFVTSAASGGLAEVELGQLAEQKAASPQVKEFARTMVSDHTQANQDLQQIAQQQNLNLPKRPGKKEREEAQRLKKLSGAAFDKQYMTHMVQDHRKDISEFQRESASGKDPALKSYAQKYLPVLQKHLQMAEATSSHE